MCRHLVKKKKKKKNLVKLTELWTELCHVIICSMLICLTFFICQNKFYKLLKSTKNKINKCITI